MKKIVSLVTIQDVLDPKTLLPEKTTTETTLRTSTRKTSAGPEGQGIWIDRSGNEPRRHGWLSELSPQNIGGVLGVS
jgi:hypothetical protein